MSASRITGSLTATGSSESFQVNSETGGNFGIQISGSGAGHVYLERSIDGGPWCKLTAAGYQLAVWDYAASPFYETWEENERGALYRLTCSSITGQVDYRLSQ